jgi:hypothetical protein
MQYCNQPNKENISAVMAGYLPIVFDPPAGAERDLHTD